jgi:putative flavoprotein involved in K+ transport
VQRTHTLVIGAGQAGLATSRLLTDAGIDHVVLERGRIGERWRSERWDSLHLLTPNWLSRLPGQSYDGDDPDGYLPAAALADRFQRYAATFDAPVVGGVDVRSVRHAPAGDGFDIDTTAGTWRAANVVVATGWFADPVVPGIADGLAGSVHQVHAGRYRNPATLPDGGVLVVGASATGVQLADELARAGRDVTIAAGRHIRLPRTYRGRDVMWWMDRAGVFDDRVEDVPAHARNQPSVQLVGRAGAGIDLASLAAAGVRVTGRLLGFDGAAARLADDLASSTADADRRLHRLLDRVDGCAGHRDRADRPAPMRLPAAPAGVDLRAEGITTVLWATGFRPSFPWLQVPVLGAGGTVVHRHGVTAAPGLYVVGMRWQTRRSSTFVDGARHDARAVVDHLRRRDRGRGAAA